MANTAKTISLTDGEKVIPPALYFGWGWDLNQTDSSGANYTQLNGLLT